MTKQTLDDFSEIKLLSPSSAGSEALEASKFLNQSAQHLTIDVRSPKEYAKGHIPHAINIPLFNDEERAIVGTLYKQRGRQPAIEKGLEIVGPKMAQFARVVKPLVKDNTLYIHCWRGGMRSGSMAWLYRMLGYRVFTLLGGYKAYRNNVLVELSKPLPYTVLGGYTGSGKTAVLLALAAMGEQVIDLEGIAHHRGSAFGNLGQLPQPSTEFFENLIYQRLSQLDPTKTIWLEDESKNVGSCYIPNGLWGVMRLAPLVVLEIPFEVRVQRLVADYSGCDMEGLKESIIKIERRLGNEATKKSLEMLAMNDYAEVARITLRYYDKTYLHGLSTKDTKYIQYLAMDHDDINAIAEKLLGR